jgi:hypothetical protein
LSQELEVEIDTGGDRPHSLEGVASRSRKMDDEENSLFVVSADSAREKFPV